MKLSKLIILSLFTLLMYNCSSDSESDLIPIKNEEPKEEEPGNGSNDTINYKDDISPIMQSSCVGCHASPPVNGAPFALVNFSQVSQRANGILNVMSKQSGTPSAMPPSGRLPQSTIDLLQKWIDAGKPEN